MLLTIEMAAVLMPTFPTPFVTGRASAAAAAASATATGDDLPLLNKMHNWCMANKELFGVLPVVLVFLVIASGALS
ncbi:hypothetical protein WJX73_006065 [Symbiochloris irregularis]|uniref:Uncharacterized protein n=1 Tax=Symbiochloris irregularis TaxID=706552 RepID=A0AAW1P8D5_9CHLO